MSLTISPSPFGSLVVSVAETGSTLSVTTVATSPSVLTMALGVPGPTGATGATGPAGQNGVGVPVGGTTGQALVKLSGTNYDTGWTSINSASWGNITGTLSNQTDLYDALSGKLSLTGGSILGSVNFNYTNNPELDQRTLTINYESLVFSGDQNNLILNEGIGLRWYDGVGWMTYSPNYIQFPDATQQSTAGLPLTGGTVTGSISVYDPIGSSVEILLETGNNISVLDHATNLGTYLSQNGIGFPDNTTQTTAFPPAGGTTSQYIDGTGALQTFPTVTTAGKMVTSVRNNSGATITKGTVVYINGAVGNKPTIAKAQANTEATSKATFAFVEADIANNAEGNVVQIGLLENIDTQGFSDGTQIYLSPTVAGGWTSTQPFSPYHYVRLGTVIRGGHPTLGSISVSITNGFQLDEMSDVGATAPTNNNVLTWVSASSQWLDRSITTILGYTPANDTLGNLSNATTARSNLGLTSLAISSFATTAQAQAGTSTTTVVNPSTLLDAKWFSGGKGLNVNSYSTLTSGTGAVAGTIGMNAQQVASPTTATGYGSRYGQIINSSRGLSYTGALDFSKRVIIGGRFQKQTATTDSNAVFRFYCGKTNTVGDMTSFDKGIGFRVAGSGAIQLTVANGSLLTTTTSTFTPTINQCYDVVIVSDGSGNATLYVNGSSVATSTGSPTNTATNNYFGIEAQNLAVISTPVAYYMVTDLFAQVNL